MRLLEKSWAALVACTIAFVGGCSCSSTTPSYPAPTWAVEETGKYEPVMKVFMNKANNYTVMVQNGTTLEPKTIGGSIKLLTDVSEDKPMYVAWKKWKCTNKDEARYSNGARPYEFTYEYEIHIHNAKQIAAGTWEEEEKYKSGKYTRYRTVSGKVQEIE